MPESVGNLDALKLDPEDLAVAERVKGYVMAQTSLYFTSLIFTGGLLDEYRYKVAAEKFSNISDCLKEAKKLERSREELNRIEMASEANEADIRRSSGENELHQNRQKPNRSQRPKSSNSKSKGAAIRNGNINAGNSCRQAANAGDRSQEQRNVGNGGKKNLECWHCGKKGHVIDVCYSRLRGEPKQSKNRHTRTQDNPGSAVFLGSTALTSTGWV